MPKVLKLMSTIHLLWCTVVLGTSTCCQLRDFLPSRRKGLLQHIGVNEVSVKRDSTVFCLTATHLFFFSFSITRLRKTCSSHTLDPTIKLFFSFNNITTRSNIKVNMRMNVTTDTITDDEMSWCFNKFSH